MRGDTYRVVKNKNYSVINNFHLWDLRMSALATTLLTRILAMPDTQNITKHFLVSRCREGKAAVARAVAELERCGYIERRERPRTCDGRFGGVEYIVYEVPKDILVDLDTGRISQRDALKQLYDAEKREKPPVRTEPCEESGKPGTDVGVTVCRKTGSGCHDVGVTAAQKQAYGQTDVGVTAARFSAAGEPDLGTNKYYNNKYYKYNNNQSVLSKKDTAQSRLQASKKADPDHRIEKAGRDGQDRDTDNRRVISSLPDWFNTFDGDLDKAFRWTDDWVSKNICYDNLKEIYRETDAEAILDEIRRLIVDTICTTRSTERIGGREIPAGIVRSVFLKINLYTIMAVIERLDANTTEIRNRRAYLLTMLYDAQTSKKYSEKMLLNHMDPDLCGGSICSQLRHRDSREQLETSGDQHELMLSGSE